jgi:hypothetical protein
VIVKKHRRISNGNRTVFDFLTGGKGVDRGSWQKIENKGIFERISGVLGEMTHLFLVR